MHKILSKLTPKKKVEMRDLVSPRPSKSASRVLKTALKKSYADQQMIRERATAIRSN